MVDLEKNCSVLSTRLSTGQNFVTQKGLGLVKCPIIVICNAFLLMLPISLLLEFNSDLLSNNLLPLKS